MLDFPIPAIFTVSRTHYSFYRRLSGLAFGFLPLLSLAVAGCSNKETTNAKDAMVRQDGNAVTRIASDANNPSLNECDANAACDSANVDVSQKRTKDGAIDIEVDARLDGSREASTDATGDSDCAWNLIFPELSDATLRAIWGSADNDIYVVGDHSTMLHYDGKNWSVIRIEEKVDLLDIWGSAANDIYVVGGDNRTYLSEIATTGTSSKKAALLHYDGTEWLEIDLGVTGLITGVWGSESNDIYAAATEGLYHFNGVDWQLVSLPQGDGKSISDVSGCGRDDVYAVDRGTRYTYHFDGSQWTASQIAIQDMPPWSGFQRPGIWCSAPDDVWIIGRTYGSAVLRWNGTSWQTLENEAEQTAQYRLHGFFETADGKRYLSGAEGALLRFEQGVWRTTTIDTRRTLYGIWTTNGEEIFLAGESGALYKVSQTGIESVSEILGSEVVSFLDLGARGFAAVNDRADLLLGKSNALRVERFSNEQGFLASTAIALATGEILIGGGFCRASRSVVNDCAMQPGGQPAILRYDENGFSQIETIEVELSEAPMCDNISDFWRIGDDVLAVCYSGDLLWREGEAWRLISQQSTCALGFTYSEISGSSADDLFVYGLRDVGPPVYWMYGYICHYDGFRWKEIPVSEVPNSLVAVWSNGGEPYALRQYTAAEKADCEFSIERFDGSKWSPLARIPDPSNKTEVWNLPGPNAGYFSHEACNLTVAYDGIRWTILPDKPDNTVTILKPSGSPNETIAATVQGGIYQRVCE